MDLPGPRPAGGGPGVKGRGLRPGGLGSGTGGGCLVAGQRGRVERGWFDGPAGLDAGGLAAPERALADRVQDKTVSEARAEVLKAAAAAGEAEREIFAAAADVFGDMQVGAGSHPVLIGAVATLADEAAPGH